MTKMLQGLCFAGLGGLIAGAVALVVVLFYSYETPAEQLIVVAVGAGSLVGLVSGALWGRPAIKWMLKALANL